MKNSISTTIIIALFALFLAENSHAQLGQTRNTIRSNNLSYITIDSLNWTGTMQPQEDGRRMCIIYYYDTTTVDLTCNSYIVYPMNWSQMGKEDAYFRSIPLTFNEFPSVVSEARENHTILARKYISKSGKIFYEYILK